MMKRLWMIALMCSGLSLGMVAAQGELGCTISVDAAFSITFETSADALALPNSDTILSCGALPETVAAMYPSEGVQRGGALGRPRNDADDVMAQRGYAIVDTSAANLRSGDAPGYTVVAIVRGRDPLYVLGRNERATWWYVQAGELRGWIANELVALRGDVTPVPIVTSLVGEFITPTLYVGWGGNPLYDIAGTSGNVVCGIKGRSEYDILGRSKDFDWVYIAATCTNNTPVEGWLPTELGLVRNPAELSIPVIE